MLFSTIEDASGVSVPDIAKVAAALARAQGKFLPLVRSKSVTIKPRDGNAYTFQYAPLESCLASVRAALSEEELALTQSVVVIPEGMVLRTWLLHSSGQFLSNDTPMMIEGNGPKALASAETYARRYGVSALLGLAADDDDDGSAATGDQIANAPKPGVKVKGEKITVVQAAELHAKMTQAGADPVLFAKFLGVPTVEDLLASQLPKATAALDAKIAANAKAEKAAKPAKGQKVQPLGPPMTEPFSGGKTPEELDLERSYEQGSQDQGLAS
jgi:hypothetical protein